MRCGIERKDRTPFAGESLVGGVVYYRSTFCVFYLSCMNKEHSYVKNVEW